MATVLGAGTSLAAAWLLDPVTTVTSRLETSLPPFTPAPEPELPVDAPETLDLLARAAWVLQRSSAGLTLTELRLMLSEPTDALQRALAAGLRTKQLRRLGSRSKLRYALNV